MPVQTRRARRRMRNALLLQRWWRRCTVTDPISLEPVAHPAMVFRHVDDASGRSTYFNALSLARNMTHGDYKNPVTRVLFKPPEVLRVQHIAARFGFERNLLEDMRYLIMKRKLERERTELLDYLRDTATRAGQEIVHAATETTPRNLFDTISRLQNGLFQQFSSAIADLRFLDQTAARRCVADTLNAIPRSHTQPIVVNLVRSFLRLIVLEQDTAFLYHPALIQLSWWMFCVSQAVAAPIEGRRLAPFGMYVPDTRSPTFAVYTHIAREVARHEKDYVVHRSGDTHVHLKEGVAVCHGHLAEIYSLEVFVRDDTVVFVHLYTSDEC